MGSFTPCCTRTGYVILTIVVLAALSVSCWAASLLPLTKGRQVLAAVAPLGGLAVSFAERGWGGAR